MILLAHLTKKDILKYMFTPQVGPRLNSFVTSGFQNLAIFMAMVYRMVRLLPENHAYLKPHAMGTFSVRDVLNEAAKNLTFDVKHLDQIIIFFALITGIIILAIQFVLLLMTFLVNPARAQVTMPSNYSEFWTTPNPEEDIALRLLDGVFGVPDIFGSNQATETDFHTALHQLFQFYSIGLLVIAFLILAYYIFVVLAETAQTGTPFGKRYNHAWAPIRLVVGIGLLIPVSYGLNSGQWIGLYAAKFGSGFATSGWIKFNETLRNPQIDGENAVATPNVPELKEIVAFMMVVHACVEAYKILDRDGNQKDIQPYIIPPSFAADTDATPMPDFFTGEDGAIKAAGGGDVRIRFGEKNSRYRQDYDAEVYPFCGEIVVTNNQTVEEATDYYSTYVDPISVIEIQYYYLIQMLWKGEVVGFDFNIEGREESDFNKNAFAEMKTAAQEMMIIRLEKEDEAGPAGFTDPESQLKADAEELAKGYIESGLTRAVEIAAGEFTADTTYSQYGWGGAGIWYNNIADKNGRIVDAIAGKPQVNLYPDAMEYVCEERQQQDASTNTYDCFNPRLSENRDIEFINIVEKALVDALNDVFEFWYENREEISGNAFIDTINAIFGTEGLFDMCKNVDIHPIAQISALGKGLVQAAIRNLGFAIGGGVGALAPYIGPTLSAASGFFSAIASIGILIGFILYYLVPFMPFLYFFFAVGGWVKGIFEAMVGIPLWALAHLRIDGQGLPGDGALNGYFLIFEIFIRPILIVFGMLASILIFAAMVKVLNEVFYLAVSNLSGFGSGVGNTCGVNASPTDAGTTAPAGSIDYLRGPVDEFFFTIVYAILVYMIGMSSFKLIDMIPNQILRWMGAGVPTFGDQAGEPAEGLMQKVAIGGGLIGGQLQQVGSSFGQAAGSLGRGAIGTFTQRQ